MISLSETSLPEPARANPQIAPGLNVANVEIDTNTSSHDSFKQVLESLTIESETEAHVTGEADVKETHTKDAALDKSKQSTQQNDTDTPREISTQQSQLDESIDADPLAQDALAKPMVFAADRNTTTAQSATPQIFEVPEGDVQNTTTKADDPAPSLMQTPPKQASTEFLDFVELPPAEATYVAQMRADPKTQTSPPVVSGEFVPSAGQAHPKDPRVWPNGRLENITENTAKHHASDSNRLDTSFEKAVLSAPTAPQNQTKATEVANADGFVSSAFKKSLLAGSEKIATEVELHRAFQSESAHSTSGTTPYLQTNTSSMPLTTHHVRALSPQNTATINDAVISLRDSGGQIDVSLSPEDLGRVSVKLEHTLNGTQITFAADRPETQELMRRQMEHLQNQFKQMGFDNLSFSFEQNQNGKFIKGDASDAEKIASSVQALPDSTNLTLTSPVGGLDIRI